MSYQHKPNKGSSFKNKNKQANTHPDYSGDALINGKHYWINTWVNESRDGLKYFAHSFVLKDAKFAEAKEAAGDTMRQDFDDEIPF